MTDGAVLVANVGDVIDDLPPAAADQLRSLRQAREDAAVLRRSAADAREEARQALLAARMRLQQLIRPDVGLSASDQQIEAQQEKIRRAQAEFDRLQAVERRHADAWRSLSMTVSSIEAWLRKGLAVEDAPLPPSGLKKTEDASLAEVYRLLRDPPSRGL